MTSILNELILLKLIEFCFIHILLTAIPVNSNIYGAMSIQRMHKTRKKFFASTT